MRMELDTAVRHKLPILVVISLNGGWTADPEKEKPGRDLGYTRYDKMAEALGCYGEYVEKPDDIRPALERAAAAVARGSPPWSTSSPTGARRPAAPPSPITGPDGRPRNRARLEQIMMSQSPEPAWRAPLDDLRGSIDNIDAALLYLLAERFKCTQRVGELKARYQLPPGDPAREAIQIERLRTLARAARLDPDFAEKFLNFIIKEVIRHHEAIKERR